MDFNQIKDMGRKLNGFTHEFDDCFGRSEPRANLRTYMRGQLSKLERKTVAYMRDALASRPKPADKEEAKLCFLTPSGHAWVRQHVHRSPDNVIDKVVSTDDVCREFEEMLKALKLSRKGVGFYALRHTFRTWADEVRDQHAIHRIMGHAIPGMSGVYVENISLDRLRAVTDHVRSKVFAREQDSITS